MSPRRTPIGAVLTLAGLALLGATGATATTTLSATARFTRGDHPDRQILWLRSTALPPGSVLWLLYSRSHDPANRGKISGKCEIEGGDGSIAIRRVRIRDRQASRGYRFPKPLADGDRLQCRLVFKKMPAVPDGGWSEVRIEIAAPEIFPP